MANPIQLQQTLHKLSALTASQERISTHLLNRAAFLPNLKTNETICKVGLNIFEKQNHEVDLGHLRLAEDLKLNTLNKPTLCQYSQASQASFQQKNQPVKQTSSIDQLPELNRNPNGHVILIMGAPGSGKGSLCQALTSLNPAFKHISIGEEIRLLLNDPTHPITQKYCNIVVSGQLLPDHVVDRIVHNIITTNTDPNRVILLDGYPRTGSQLTYFQNKVTNHFTVVQLDIKNTTALERLVNRKADRADDQIDIIQMRLEIFEHETKKMLNQIADHNKTALIRFSTENTITNLTSDEHILYHAQHVLTELNQRPELADIFSENANNSSHIQKKMSE